MTSSANTLVKPLASRARLTKALRNWPRLRSVLRSSISAVNTPLAKTRMKRALATSPRPLRLEIGGLDKRPGWVVSNVNAITPLYLDATTAWPLEDGAIEYLFSDNVIEHIPLEACRAMLAEAHRCLQSSGVIRLVTPDIRAHVDMYLAGVTSLDTETARHYRRGRQVVEHPVDLIRIPIGAFGHHAGYVYDFETLAAELRRAGFTNPVRCDVGSSQHQALSGLETRNPEGGTQLVVEATA